MPKEAKRIALKILKYLGRNPFAMDTAKGIAEWWIQEEPRKVEECLAFLVGRNLIRISTLQGRSLYWLNRELHGESLRAELERIGSVQAGSAADRNGGVP